MEQESKKLRDSLEDIKVFEYLQDIDKLHLVSFISQKINLANARLLKFQRSNHSNAI